LTVRAEPPKPVNNDMDLHEYLRETHEELFGLSDAGGRVNGKTAVADTSDVSDTATQLNALLAVLREQNIIGA